MLDPRWLPALGSYALRVRRAAPRAEEARRSIRPGEADLTSFAFTALPRLAAAAARLAAASELLHPSLLVGFSESGIWGRILPAVAHQRHLPSLDLPHAEAADPWGSVGIGYDVVAVYGPRATEIMLRAGVAAERICEVGPIRYDALVKRSRTRRPPAEVPRRIVFASQPARPGSRVLGPQSKAAAVQAAPAAAVPLAPAQLVFRPHPTETDSVGEETLAACPRRAGVTFEIERVRGLHELLDGAWLLVTGSSQSVYEAAIAGVPCLMVNPSGEPDPVPFAEEGIAIRAEDGAGAAAAAVWLMDANHRRRQVARARAALRPHFGALDGAATARTAELIIKLASRSGAVERPRGALP